jgi:hypothetical protein
VYQTVALYSLILPSNRRLVLSGEHDEPLILNPGKYMTKAIKEHRNSRARFHEIEEMRRLQGTAIYPLNVTFTDCVFEVS